MKSEIIEKIMQKKEFSDLPIKDVELVFESFDKDQYVEEEKIKLTRDLLRKMYTAFVSDKLLNVKEKSPEWFLRKHLSTKERLDFYSEVYEKILKGSGKKITILDLGCGINGFSYDLFKKINPKIKYVGVEAVGQLVDLQNHYFAKNNYPAKVIHESLFEKEKIVEIIKKEKGDKIIFLFKTLDSLEMLKRDYSKELLNEIVSLADKVVVSFATKSLIAKKKFNVKRNWIINFIKDNFKILDDEEIGSERYVIFCKK